MAKRTTKKAGQDFPPLYTLVEKGWLVPAFQADYERISSYRDGTRMVVHIQPDGARKGVRDWYRIIGAVCKKDLLHGLSSTQADEAIRGALDMFTPVRMANGKWIEQRTSLNDLDDSELDDKLELMKGVLLAWTGVDPDTFGKEITNSQGDENFSSDVHKEGFARQPAAQVADAAGSGGADSSSPQESGATTILPEDPNPNPPSGEAPAAASTPSTSGGGTPDAAMMIAAVPDDVKPGVVGMTECPNCGNLLKWSRAASNGHVAVQCMKINGDRGCWGPLMLSMDKDAIWPRQKQSPGAAVSAQAEADQPAAPVGGESGSGGLVASGPDLRPGYLKPDEDLPAPERTFMLMVAKAAMPICKEGTTRDEVIKVFGPFVKTMPPKFDKRASERLDRMMNHVRAVGRGDEQTDWELIANLAMTTVKELAELE